MGGTFVQGARGSQVALGLKRLLSEDPTRCSAVDWFIVSVSPQLIRSDSISPKVEEQHYSFVYISHPRAVTGFSWRKTSKFMPR